MGWTLLRSLHNKLLYLQGVRVFKKLIFIPVLIIMGCNSDSSKEIQEFNEWQDSNITSYSFNYTTTGFVPSIGGTWRIQVHNDEVIHTQLVIGDIQGEWVLSPAPTIDELIVKVVNCQESADCDVSLLELDEVYKYPSKVTLSSGSEGSGFVVSEFEVQ
jgi:hypothetical protein